MRESLAAACAHATFIKQSIFIPESQLLEKGQMLLCIVTQYINCDSDY